MRKAFCEAGSMMSRMSEEKPNSDSDESENSICEELGMADLPPEILIYLFSFLDGLSLVRVSCVNRKFRDVASSIWQPVFEKELQESVLDVAPGVYMGLHRPHRFHSPEVPWKKLYTSVMIWQTCKRWHVSVTLSEVLRDEISAFAIAGPEAVLGTNSGYVLKLCKEDLNPDLLSEHSNSRVNSVVIQSSSEDDYDGDESLRYRVISLSRDRCLKVHDLHHGYSMTNFTRLDNLVGYQDTLHEWSTMSDEVFDLRLNIQNEAISRVRLSMKLPTPRLHGRIMAIDPAQNLCVTHVNGPMTWDETSNMWTPILRLDSKRFSRGYVFPYGITISITTNYFMVVTVGRTGVLIEWPVTMRPTSALLHGQVFIVGTESGHLVIYFLKSRQDIVNISPLRFDAKFYTNQSSSVLHLGVSEADNGHLFPSIFAATRKQIILLQPKGLKR